MIVVGRTSRRKRVNRLVDRELDRWEEQGNTNPGVMEELKAAGKRQRAAMVDHEHVVCADCGRVVRIGDGVVMRFDDWQCHDCAGWVMPCGCPRPRFRCIEMMAELG